MNRDLKSIKKRFLTLNRERLRRTQDSLRWKQRGFLQLLPLLFHINHPLLPGYTSKKTPAGIPDYIPSQEGLDAAKRLTKTFHYTKRALRSFEVLSIFMMGSSGTIAYSEKSDFDIWICHKPSLSKDRLSELHKKILKIEAWADSIDLEVHFFLMNAESFKKGEHVNLSQESSGTAQHHLLLEEFYRTGLLVAGRYPIWWLVPPEHEHKYQSYVSDLLRKRFVSKYESIDFGGLDQIPAEEFFGAALWQVYKGIDSPYKSVIKILLMEAYAQEYPNIDLLSMHFKRAVYEGETDINQLDPYIMLIKKLEKYLGARNERQRLELLRRCFYFKVNAQLSDSTRSSQSPWRYQIMQALAAKWGWNNAYLDILDSRTTWKIQRVLKERKILVDELTNSYLFLSGFARKYARLSHISQNDLNILGRKLYAAFERKAGKIDIVNRGIAPDLVETHLSFNQVYNRDGHEAWMLFHGTDVVTHPENNPPLKRGRCFLALLAWCHFNRLMNSITIIALHTQTGALNIREVKEITRQFQRLYHNGDLPQTDMESFSMQPRIISSMIFINVGVDPATKRNRLGNDIISNKSDILKYSGFSLNLAESFDLVVVTSWQEVLTFTYMEIHGFMDCICQYVQWNFVSTGPFLPPPLPESFCFTSSHSKAIADRVREVFEDIINYFQKCDDSAEAYYILESAQGFHIIHYEKGNLRPLFKANYIELLAYLARPYKRFSNVQFDKHAIINTVLPLIFKFNKKDTVQLFFQKNGGIFDIYVLDEDGSLFNQCLPLYDATTLINQFDHFFEAILYRKKIQARVQEKPQQIIQLEFYRIYKGKTGNNLLEKCCSTRGTKPRRYFNIQVIGNVERDKTEFVIYCDGQEFSSYEYGNDLFRTMAKHVLNLRRSGLRYPIYITDLDLSPALMNEESSHKIPTVNYLNYKKRIEDKLNKELELL